MTAINQLPARIASKLASITCTRKLALIRSNRLARKTTNYSVCMRRHHIFLACIDRSVEIRKARNAAFRELVASL